MQAYDPTDKLILTEELNILEAPDVLARLVERADVAKVVIAPLPKIGDDIEHNGLKFEVTGVLSRGRFVIKLIKPVETNGEPQI